MKRQEAGKLIAAVLATALMGCWQLADAQVRIVGAVSGTVKDASGALVPGAKVVLKDEGTGIAKESVSNGSGQFLLPDLSFGSFQVTVSAAGFQTVVVDHIHVEASKTSDIAVTLKVGQQADSVTVEGSALAIETTSNLVSKSITSNAIAELPILGRGTLGFARLVPGQVTAPNSNVNGGDTHWNNMPGGAMNITFDGINNASNGFKSGGTVFYNTVPARLGATEEVSVETAGLGADSGAQSGTNIKFITKRGSSQYHGSAFYQPSSEQFNANSWSRNATPGQGFRTKNRLHDFGGNFGGKLVPFGYLKDKLFFFVNFEDSWNPRAPAQTKSVLLPQAQQGIYTYRLADGSLRTANVLQIAGANGFPTMVSPAIQFVLSEQNKAVQNGLTIPIVNNFNSQNLTWSDPNNINDYYPTTRLDYYITPALQLTGTWNLRHEWVPGARPWPLPDYKPINPFRIGGYFVYSLALEWTMSPRTFNEFRYGVQHSGDTNARSEYTLFNTYNNQPLRLNNMPYVTTLHPDQQNVTGRHYITTIYDTATLNRGLHTITIGGTYRATDWHDTGETFPFPSYSIGTPSNDPVSAAFNSTTLPGINNTDIAGAAQLYALLTGRISGVSARYPVDPKTLQYNAFINPTWTRSHMGGVYAQDRWRVKPNLTLNFGLREELQGDMFNVDNLIAIPDQSGIFGPSVGLFQPGVFGGTFDPLLQVQGHAFRPDYFNLAPNFGVAWNPNGSGLLGKLLGGNKTVVRGHYGLVYYDEGTQMFAATVNNNPGGKIQTKSFTPGQSGVPFGLTVDGALANGLPGYTNIAPTSFVKTLHESDVTFSNTLNSMKPTLRTPYVITWSFGIQRELARNVVFEANYIGNHSHHSWRNSNLNEVNIFENGFLKEFINAQNNLKVNAANGVSNNFGSLGFPGDAPLPIFQTAFGARGSAPALSTAQGFGSSTYITPLQNGAAGQLANALASNSSTACRMFGNTFAPCARIDPNFNAAGPYPINFWYLNPYSAGTLMQVEDSGWNSYNGLQAVLRKRTSRGLSMQINYTFAKGLTNERTDDQTQIVDFTTRRNLGLDKEPSPFDIRQVFQVFGTYDLPVGKGRRFGISNRMLDTVFGGWTVGSIVNIQTGSPIPLTGGFQTVNANQNLYNNGGVRGQNNGVILAPGVTLDQIQNALVNSQGPFTNRYSIDTKWIGADGRASTQYFLTPSTPGQFGQLLYIHGKPYWSWDASLIKNFQITERVKFNLWTGATNVLNHPQWGIQTPLNIQSTTFGQVGAPITSARAVQFRGTLTF